MTEKAAQVTKRVTFTEKNDDEQKAAGIVMVPNKVDLHGDWERPDTIQSFAEQFEALESAGEASGGVMHAVWPDDHVELSRNEIAGEDTTVGGQGVPEGAWIQEWEFRDEDLWSLVDDGVLEGYSIGAIDVSWDGPIEQDDLPDEVAVPDDIPDGEPVWELTDGIIREVSAVDVPAVPDAMILETKAEAEKRLAEHLGNREAFIEEAMDRGHSEADAERLWEYLNRAVEVEGSDEPGKESMFARIGKAAVKAFTGSDDEAKAESSEAQDRSEKEVGDFEADVFRVVAPEGEAENFEDEVLGIGVDFPNSDVYVDWRNEVFPDELDEPHVSIYGSISDLEQATGNTTEQIDTLNAKAAKTLFDASSLQVPPVAKEGRTLSRQNRESLYATIDASLDILQDAGVEHGMSRFTDRDDNSFDLSEHQARNWQASDDEEDEDEEDAVDASSGKDAAGGDTPGDEGGQEAAADMTDKESTDDGEDAEKSLAEQNAEQINELTSAVESLTETLSGPEQKTAEIEIGGETYEVPESEVKSALGVDEDAGVDVADAIESLKSQVENVNSRVDTINQQTGGSDQLDASAETDGEDDEKGLEGLGKALS